MKNKLIILIMLFSYNMVCGQTVLKLEGSNFSYTKGNIDTELLTEIIQQKQEEFAQRAFKNLVLKNFDQNGAEKNFASYYYIYNLLNTITTEKNKKVITRQVISNILEYSLVYGLAIQFFKSKEMEGEQYHLRKGSVLISDLIKKQYNGIDTKEVPLAKNTVSNEWKAFNIYIDMAYDILLNDPNINKKGLFLTIKQSSSLKTWYDNDNAYMIHKKEQELIEHHEQMRKIYSNLVSQDSFENDIYKILIDLKDSDFKPESLTKKQYDTIRKILQMAISKLKNYSDNNIIATMSEFLLDYTLIEYKEESSIKKDSTSKMGILYIDAEGLISSLYEKFANSNKSSTISKKFGFLIPKPFLTIGTSYGGTFHGGNLLINDSGAVSDLNSLYFASEKIGFKFTLDDKKYTRSFGPAEQFEYRGRKTAWIRPQPMPIIVRQEIMLYGSGLLYNIVDIKSKKNFNYSMAGVAYGLTFFNGLVLGVGASAPIDANNGVSFNKKMMYNISFDIPIIEYISALKKKK